MKISISFSIVILAIAGLAHSAPPPPQEKPSTSVSSAFGENDLKEIAEIFQSFDKKTKTPNKDVVPKLLKDLSGECKTALLSIVAEPEFSKCVPLSALEPLVPILTPDLIKGLASNTTATLKKIQSNLVEFSTDVCKAPKCSDKGLESALKSVQDGCKADLDNKLIKLVIAGVSLYSPARDAVCTKDDKGKFCLSGDDIDGLKASPIVMVGGILDDIAASDTKDVCAECNGKIVNTFFSYIESESPLAKAAKEVFGKQGDKKLGAAKLGVALKCGVESLVLPKSPKHSQLTNTTSTTSSTSPTSRPTRPPKHSSSPTSVSLSPTFPTEPPKHSSKKTNPTPDSTDLPKQTSTSY